MMGNTPRGSHHLRINDAVLRIVRKITSTHITTEAVPLDWVPPSIGIPNSIFVKRKNINCVGGYFGKGFKYRIREASQFYMVICGKVNFRDRYETFRMLESSPVRL